jgi:hypothetical protein
MIKTLKNKDLKKQPFLFLTICSVPGEDPVGAFNLCEVLVGLLEKNGINPFKNYIPPKYFA